MSESESPNGGGSSPDKIQEWKVKMVVGKGCLGPSTCTATGERDGSVITAVASDESSALSMLENMIVRRTSPAPKS